MSEFIEAINDQTRAMREIAAAWDRNTEMLENVYAELCVLTGKPQSRPQFHVVEEQGASVFDSPKVRTSNTAEFTATRKPVTLHPGFTTMDPPS